MGRLKLSREYIFSDENGDRVKVWVETVTEGGRRFMAAWRKEEVGAARHRQEKREATRLGNLLSQTGVENCAKPHPLA